MGTYSLITLPNYFEIIANGGTVWVQTQGRFINRTGPINMNQVMRETVFQILHEIWAHIDYRKGGKNDDRRDANPNNMGNPMENDGWLPPARNDPPAFSAKDQRLFNAIISTLP